jgi:hypothetical protein
VFYNIGLFLRFIMMLLVGAQGEWKTLDMDLSGRLRTSRRWSVSTADNHWTAHEPINKVGTKATEYWFSRTELLLKKHMKPNFRTFREEEPKG